MNIGLDRVKSVLWHRQTSVKCLGWQTWMWQSISHSHTICLSGSFTCTGKSLSQNSRKLTHKRFWGRGRHWRSF